MIPDEKQFSSSRAARRPHFSTPLSRILPSVVAMVSLVSAAAASAQPVYTVTDLGAVAGSGGSVAVYVNDRGYVAGTSASSPSAYETGVVWRDGRLVNLGLLPKGNYTDATAVNSQGVAVGDGDTGN